MRTATRKAETMTIQKVRHSEVLTEAMIYWNTRGKLDNQGWDYRVRFSDGHEEEGEWKGALADYADRSDLEGAVIDLCLQHGVEIESGDVAADPKFDGGYGHWTL